MASSLEDDLLCAVCLEIYQDPQILSCGHTFCQRCVGYYHVAFSAFYTRRCPVCQQTIKQEPVSNLALKNTCKTYVKVKEKERKLREEREKEDGGIKCHVHGEKIQYFCRTDGEVICCQCMKQSHVYHSVQTLTQNIVHQRRDQLKAAVRPAKKVLMSLRNGTALECKITKYIESQAEQTERQIKEEFEKLHQFLREEEETRRTALRDEEKVKKGKLEGWIERELLSISDRLMEVEEEMEKDDAPFLSNYDHVVTRARYTPSDSQLDEGALIHVAKHVGNLRFHVWQKMKDHCPYYPVVLDPNSSHTSVSGDLVCVSQSIHRFYSRNPLQKNDNHLVLGSEAQNASFNCWDVEVGNSTSWTLGVCRRSVAQNNHMRPLIPQNGFYGLRRNGDFYSVLGSTKAPFQLRRPPKAVRVKLTQRLVHNTRKRSWMLRFLDASNGSEMADIGELDFGKDLVPFLIPEERDATLRILPVNVNTNMEDKFSFWERHMDMLSLCAIIVIIIMSIVMNCVFSKTHQ